MFSPPLKTLQRSLSTVLTHAEDYGADVCFVFNEERIWAHKALLLARVPDEFMKEHMPQLVNNTNSHITIDIANVVSHDLFVHLIRFWYTADFSTLSPSSSSSCSSKSLSLEKVTITSEPSSSSLSCTVRESVAALETKLGRSLLPSTTGVSDGDQLVADLTAMRRNQLHCDVMVNIFKPNNTTAKKKPPPLALAPAPAPVSVPILTKRHTTPANITTTSKLGVTSSKSDTITSILHTGTTPSSSIKATGTGTTVIASTAMTSTPEENEEEEKEKAHPLMITFPVHRFILAARSSYFHSLLDSQVCEASNSTVLLPYDLFSSTTLDIILHYFYTDQLQVPDIPLTESMSVFQKEMNRKKHILRELQKVFRAADYLGHIDSLCNAALYEMETICHRFKCSCSSCVILLPSMLAFANKHRHQVRQLRSQLLTMYTEPIQAMPPLWSQKPFSLLILSHLDGDLVAVDGGNFILPASLQCLFHPTRSSSSTVSLANSSNPALDDNTASVPIDINSKRPTITTTESSTPSSSASSSPSPSPITASSPCSTESSSLLVDLISMTLANITKRNAIHVLHSVHLCLSKIRSSDPFPTWSQPSLALIHALLHHTISMVSLNFDYYCVDYPILLSCVDGIGGGFSVDFLEFLLKRLLKNGIQDSNAAVLYQGIVRDLIGRQEVVKNVAVDGVLLEARQQCVDYLSHRWIGVKAQGGFQTIEKDVLRMMAEDINVPYRSLSKPVESEFTSMFGFKPKSSSKQKSPPAADVGTADMTYKSGNNNNKSNILDTVPTTATATSSTLPSFSSSGSSATVTATPSSAGAISSTNISSKSRRRLSLGSLRYPRSSLKNSSSNNNNHHNSNRLSADVRGWMDSFTNATDNGSSSSNILSSPDMDDHHSLSDNDVIVNSKHSYHRHLSLQPKRRTHHITRRSSSSSLTDVLLPVDVSPTIVLPSTTSSPNNNAQRQQQDQGQGAKDEEDANNDIRASVPEPRKSRLTFELPETPIRAKFATQVSTKSSSSSSSSGQRRRRTRSPKHKYRWSLGGSKDSASDSAEEDETQLLMPVVGAKVELLRRPLPTLGRIKFIGNVQFSKGTWVGVELESRLGQNDGSVDGVRYFQTDPQRGVFVKLDGLKLISGPIKP